MLDSECMQLVKEKLSVNTPEGYILEDLGITHEEFMLYQLALLIKGEI